MIEWEWLFQFLAVLGYFIVDIHSNTTLTNDTYKLLTTFIAHSKLLLCCYPCAVCLLFVA